MDRYWASWKEPAMQEHDVRYCIGSIGISFLVVIALPFVLPS